MLYLARKLTGNKETLKTIYYSLVMLYGVSARGPGGVCSKTRADKLKSCKREQHGLSLRLITLSDHGSSDVLNSLECSRTKKKEERGIY